MTAEENLLWRRLTDNVRPYAALSRPVTTSEPAAKISDAPPTKAAKGRIPPIRQPAAPPPPPARTPVALLDRSWEKRIRSGGLQPEMSIDLHNHSVAAAHGALDAALDRAIAQGIRTLLIVTGKPRPGRVAPDGRGAIRAEIGHWLERSPHADRIASVRIAHPRHGGDGALYVILRRTR